MAAIHSARLVPRDGRTALRPRPALSLVFLADGCEVYVYLFGDEDDPSMCYLHRNET
ncbi:hypothetical protein ACFYY2_32090 [Streptomyces sp. NPDC001822]|uniref:hypothetical protein n=1 Tax=Streptomyces sp. NPDC001822 TaxID=3364614 RepID=UPI0036BFAC5A